MAENVRPPVAIRIVRPYESEDHLLEHELETIGKTSVILIGAHPRPTGVILRFEVTLASGVTVLRGEGRVLAHKENAFRGQAGLTLRFTRLDPRSKAVVDRATAMREARSQTEGGTPSRPVPAAPPADGPIAEALTASTPAPAPARVSERPSANANANADADADADAQEDAVASAQASAREKANAVARTNAKRTGRQLALTPPPVPAEARQAHELTPVTSIPGEVAESPRASAPPAPEPTTIAAPRLRQSGGPSPSSRRIPAALPSQIPPEAPPSPLEPPPDRADLLARLRERAAKLPSSRVEEILSARRTP